MDKVKSGKGTRAKTRKKRAALRKVIETKRATVRGKVRSAVAVVVAVVVLSLGVLAGCNTATPASKSATSKACDNVTTVNNYIGLHPFATPKSAVGATLTALLKRFGLGATTNAVAKAVGSACADGACDCGL